MKSRSNDIRNSPLQSVNTRSACIQATHQSKFHSNSPNLIYWITIIAIVYIVLAFCVPLLLFFLLTPTLGKHRSRSKYFSLCHFYLETTHVVKQYKYSNHCAGISSYTKWTFDTNTTITMTINTSSCVFAQTPLYFCTVSGNSDHFCLTGYDSIEAPTPNSFRIYARGMCPWPIGTTMLGLANSHYWNVHWIGYYF